MQKIHRPTKRVIDILVKVSEYKNGLNFTEISQKVDIPKSTLSPILKTLVCENILCLDKNTTEYKIGPSLFKIGYTFVENIDFMEIVREEMIKVVDKCDEICQLGILDDVNILYLEKVEPEQSIKLESSVGKSLPAYSTALGKCLLSNYSEKKLREMYNDKLIKVTKNTIDNIDDLIKEINLIKEEGIAYEWGESNEQVMCLAIPIYNKNEVALSISVSVPIFRSDKCKLKSIEKLLKETKENIERYLDIVNMHN